MDTRLLVAIIHGSANFGDINSEKFYSLHRAKGAK